MRKYLLGTTALIAASAVATSAMAQLIQSKSESGVPVLTAGMVAHFEAGIASNDNNAESGGSRDGGIVNGRFAEIYIDGVLTSDNGLTYGANVHFSTGAGESEGFPGREYIYLNGGFGSIELGNWIGADSAMMICVVCRTYKGYGALDLPWKSYIISPNTNFRGGGVSSHWWNQANKVTYITPVISGFQAGISYTPNTTDANPIDADDSGGYTDMVGAGIQWNHDFDGVAIAVGAVGGLSDGFVAATTVATNLVNEVTGIGYYSLDARVQYAGFSFGGAYWDDGTGGAIKGRDFGYEKTGWAVSGSTDFGPWGVELAYSQTDSASSNRITTAARQVTGSNTLSIAPSATTETYSWDGWAVSVGYAMAPGLHWYGEVVGTNFDHAQNVTDQGITGTYLGDNSATAVLTGLVLSF